MKKIRKWLWKKYYKKYFRLFAMKLPDSISYIMLTSIEFEGEAKFIEMGIKKYEEYFIRKCYIYEKQFTA